MIGAHIRGVGSYLPPGVVHNEKLSGLMTTSDEWIRTRTGIIERRYADEGVSCSDLGMEASRRALEDAGLGASDLDFIIFATVSPDHHFPGAGCYLQAKLGVSSIGCLDIRNQCTGFLYGLSVADAFIRAGVYRNILVVGAEVQSGALDFSDRGRDMAVLFGDGAGAVVVSPVEDNGPGILYTELHADGRFAKALCMDIWDISKKPFLTVENIENGDIYPKMDGKLVFKRAVTELVQLFHTTVKKADVDARDIKYIIPHQANLRINQMVARQLGLSEDKILSNIHKCANTTAASIPILLDETYRAGLVKDGDLLLLLAFGSGFTWASVLLRW